VRSRNLLRCVLRIRRKNFVPGGNLQERRQRYGKAIRILLASTFLFLGIIIGFLFSL
jgi:hypothetical protein